MATLRDIQKRIKAVQNTQKITKAMKMVAAAKLRKVQSRMLDLRPYADKMHDVLMSLAKGADRESHPLLAFSCLLSGREKQSKLLLLRLTGGFAVPLIQIS
jgi:F-type H+-transporting ATPase subunit gamma